MVQILSPGHRIVDMGVSKNRGKTSKMDGENNGKLLEFMIWGVFKPLFVETPINPSLRTYKQILRVTEPSHQNSTQLGVQGFRGCSCREDWGSPNREH